MRFSFSCYHWYKEVVIHHSSLCCVGTWSSGRGDREGREREGGRKGREGTREKGREERERRNKG